jgi:bacterioferritin-associated ferredoxin
MVFVCVCRALTSEEIESMSYEEFYNGMQCGSCEEEFKDMKQKRKKEYEFEGHLIRLTSKDFYYWYESYWEGLSVDSFRDKLHQLDIWMHEKGIKDDRWFFIVANLLTRDLIKRKKNNEFYN